MTETGEIVKVDEVSSVWAQRISEKFPHLSHAPIVEAVVDLRTESANPLLEEDARNRLESVLSGYRYLDSRRDIKTELTLAKEGEIKKASRKVTWQLIRFRSEDEKYVAAFGHGGFTLSRLAPYEDWDRFAAEAFRLWDEFAPLVGVQRITRLGVRFINLLRLPPGEMEFGRYIYLAENRFQSILKMPFNRFHQEESYALPASPYFANVTRSVRGPEEDDERRLAIVLDIDVYTHQITPNERGPIVEHLIALHWFKNKIFFGSITETALNLLA